MSPDDAPRSSASIVAPSPADSAQTIDLLATLGKSLHATGLPAHRVEGLLLQVAARFDLPVQVLSLATGLFLSTDNGGAPITKVLRVEPGTVHLERLGRLSAIARQIVSGQLGREEAKAQINALMSAPPRWGRTATVLAYVLSAVAFSIFFGGGVPEVAIATTVGLAVGLLSMTFDRIGISRRLFELTAATSAAVIDNVAYVFFPTFVDWIPLAAGLIILLPGFSLVDALEELAHGHSISGGARLAGAGVVILAMTFGAELGIVILEPFVAEPPPTAGSGLPLWCFLPALAAIAIGSTIRFRGRPRDVGTALVASTVAIVGARLGAAGLGELAGPFLAAFVLGLLGSVFARMTQQPSELFKVPGLALLVPGSFSVRSMSALLSEQTTVGVDSAFHMFLTAMALVTGLLFSSTLVRDR